MGNNKYLKLKEIILTEIKLIDNSLNKIIDKSKIVELDQQLIGRLSRMDSIRDKEMTKANIARRNQRKSRLLEALKRLKSGDFGFCIDCDDEIDIRRLEINPIVQKCLSCMQS